MKYRKACKTCGATAEGALDMVHFAMRSHKKNYPSHDIGRARQI